MQLTEIMAGIVTGAGVGIVLIAINHVLALSRAKKDNVKETLTVLLKCNLAVLCALKQGGLVNGQCDAALEDLNAFLIKQK